MNNLRFRKFYRLFAAIAALAILVAAAPYPAQAAALPTFDVVSVKQDESVTIHTYNFPGYQLYTVRMDVVGRAGVDGIIVTQTNAGAGGSFEETYRIPFELRGKAQLAIRLESSSGVYAYNWFNNRTSTGSTGSTGGTGSTGTSIPVTGTTGRGPLIKFAAVTTNKTVTIDAFNFPADYDFKVRVGPFYNFWRGSDVVATINSGDGGNFRFTVNIPDGTKNSTWISVRLDSVTGGYYAYNAFKNVDVSLVNPDPDYVVPVTGSGCTITSFAPSSSIVKGGEFDGKWTVENTSGKTWDMEQIDYKYLYGSDLAKRGDVFDLPKTVKDGQSITIVVDMVAPKYSGYYSTTWGLVKNSTVLCYLPLTINAR